MEFLRSFKSLALILTLVISGQSEARSTATFFMLEMAAHRSRILESAIVLKRQFPHYFSHVTEEQIRLYMDQHDKPKMQTSHELVAYGYHSFHSIAERLARFHGENYNDLSPFAAKALRKTIDDLNTIEKNEKLEFFATFEINETTQSELMWLEKIVDITDVGINRTKEMGLAEKPYDGAFYLESKGDKLGAELSKWLEHKLRLHHGGLKCSSIFLY